MRRPLVLLSAAMLTAALLGSCGDDDATGGDGGSGGGTVEVIARDIEFDADSYAATAGTVEIRLVNEGAIEHTLVIEEVDGFELDVPAAGDEDEGSVELDAGTYTLFCDVPGHRDAGMEATLEVS